MEKLRSTGKSTAVGDEVL